MKIHPTKRKLNVALLKSSFSYSVSSALNALIPFVLIPILTEYLTPAEFGIVSTFMVANSVFLILIGIEQQSFVSVTFFAKEVSIRSVVSSVLLVGLFNSILLLIVAASLSYLAEKAFEISSKWIMLSICISLFQFVTQINLTLWQVKAQSLKYGIFQILNSIFSYGFSIALIVNIGLNEDGRIWGISITAVIFGLVSLYHLSKSGYLQFEFKKAVITTSLAFSAPLLPHALAGWVNSGLDRILINNAVGVSETGVYSIGYQIGMAVGLIASSFNKAFAPIIYEKLSSGNLSEKYQLVKYTYFYYVTLITFAVFLYFIAPLILRLFVGESFQSSGQYIGWIIVGFTADGLYYGVVNYIYFSKKTIIISAITFSSCLIHFAITYFLLPSHGAMAAAYSTAITYIFAFILAALVSYKICPMPWFSFGRKVL